MNYWTSKSIEFANQRNYLDELFKVYPINPNLRREISPEKESEIQDYFDSRDNYKLIKTLLKLDLFPLKDSYVAYLKRDKTAIDRNPATVNRLSGNLYQMGLTEIMNRCTEPKETNRQLGPMFKRWLDTDPLGVPIFRNADDFLNYESNCIFNGSDNELKSFAVKYLGFNREKGIDFLAKFNNKFIVGETKFLTDFGGHQNAQFADAISALNSFNPPVGSFTVIPIAIMDGVLYIKSHNKLYKSLEENPDRIVLSSLLLREFLYSI